MERDEIKNELVPLLKPFMNKSGVVEVTDSSNLIKDLNIDSADLIDIVLAVEERFSVHVPDSQIDRMKTFGDIVSLVQDLTASAAA